MKGPFPSGPANAVWATMRESPVAISNLHVQAGITVDECQRGLNWLNHFGYVENYVEHGQAMMRPLKDSPYYG